MYSFTKSHVFVIAIYNVPYCPNEIDQRSGQTGFVYTNCIFLIHFKIGIGQNGISIQKGFISYFK